MSHMVMVSQVACNADSRARTARHAQVKQNHRTLHVSSSRPPTAQQILTGECYLHLVSIASIFLQSKSRVVWHVFGVDNNRWGQVTLPPRHPQCAFVVNQAAEAAQTLFHRPGTYFLKILVKIQNNVVNFFVIRKISFFKKFKPSRMRAAQAGSLGYAAAYATPLCQVFLDSRHTRV